VLDEMKKEHRKDLSLLYYDFNNSKARLMSKMKKMSDFVIEEEGEADGDAPQPPDSNEQQSPPSKRQVVAPTPTELKISVERPVKVLDVDSPLSLRQPKKKWSNVGINEASYAMKQLDIPPTIRSSALMSSHDATSNQSKTQMELIN
jgi:hypothetical protein